MTCKDLDTWVKTKARPGDVAYWHDKSHDQHYYYFYTEPDPKPFWRLWLKDESIYKYLEEINKLKIEDTTVSKRCENCKHFNSVSVKGTAMGSWCGHEKHKGMYVPKFTSCPEHEPKDTRNTRTTPFDGVKFYLIDDKTGELGLKYVCEDCGKLMDKPGHWWLALPLRDINGKQTRPFGYHFRCEECDKKKDGKV
jgi:hypothetical protein